MGEFFLITGLAATLVPALLAFILNLFRPDVSTSSLGCLAASVAPLLLAIYILLFIAAGFAEPQPLTPLPMSEIMTGLAIDGAAVLGTLAVGYLVARLVLTFLRRR